MKQKETRVLLWLFSVMLFMTIVGGCEILTEKYKDKLASFEKKTKEKQTPLPDTTPPAVVFTYPHHDQTGVFTNIIINATFSEPMDGSTITTSSFFISNLSNSTLVTGSIVYSNLTATFVPTHALTYSTTYQAIITSHVRDMAHNALVSNITWLFTTRGAPGSLDNSFGINGTIVQHIIGIDRGRAVTLQADGRIIVAGWTTNGGNRDFVVARYHPSGILDTSFGSSGVVITPFLSGHDEAEAVVVQADGKIVVAGYAHNGANQDFGIVRYHPDGTLDTGFGTNGNGKVITPIGTHNDVIYDMAIQSDGKLVVAGHTYDGSQFDFAIARYTTDGQLDPSFGSHGVVITAIGTTHDQAFALTIQADGKIVVVGYVLNTARDFAVVRYNPDGTLDTSFGTGGKITTHLLGSDTAYDVVLQGSKILVSGFVDGRFGVVCYQPNGSLDTSFGTGGYVTTSFGGYDQASAIALQSDGKIVTAGFALFSGKLHFALARYLSNGTLDTSFGGSGTVVTIMSPSNNYIQDMVIQSDGKIVVVGEIDNSNSPLADIGIARYWP